MGQLLVLLCLSYVWMYLYIYIYVYNYIYAELCTYDRIAYVLILLVSLLQDPCRIDSVRFFNTDGQTQEAPGKANRRSRKFLN